jgi:beta-xylosidase
VHLQPAHWQDGWPLMGLNGQPVRRHAKPVLVPGQKPCAPATSDEFDGRTLGPQWQWHANHRDDWCSLAARPGWLRLFPQPAALRFNEQPNLLLQKFPARSFAVETALDVSAKQNGEEAGLVVAGESSIRLGLQHEGGENRIVLRTDQGQEILLATQSHTVKFRLQVQDGGICSFSFAAADEFVSVTQTFQAGKGTWIGAKLGLYSVKPADNLAAGHVDVNYFRFR